MEITFQLPPLLIALHTHGCKTTRAFHTAGSGGKLFGRVCQQPGGKAALNRGGWTICCHLFAQSNSVVENKQMGKDPRHLPVLGAAPMRDCPLWRDSASSFSFGVNPSATSLLKIPLQILKMTFFCSSACYLPRIFPCRHG